LEEDTSTLTGNETGLLAASGHRLVVNKCCTAQLSPPLLLRSVQTVAQDEKTNQSHADTQSFHSTLSTTTAFSYKQNKHAAVSVTLSHFLVPKQGRSTRSAKAIKPYQKEASSYNLQYPRPKLRKYMTTIQMRLQDTKYFCLV